MTRNLDDARMGARHRAALGFRESDSIVIVTSEETGEISVCYDGEMTHPVKPIELKNLVNTILQKRESSSEKHNVPSEEKADR
ncbi:DNA integrity scanning protein DisA nucleotide-binding domain protein [Leptospira santarosai str. HAI134]|nr:DNA integrity scanning protein DisA nucleotide-binding domain protein [Leptospira santarosai str. HAI134]